MKTKCVEKCVYIKTRNPTVIEDQSETGQLFHLLKAHVLINNYL